MESGVGSYESGRGLGESGALVWVEKAPALFDKCVRYNPYQIGSLNFSIPGLFHLGVPLFGILSIYLK